MKEPGVRARAESSEIRRESSKIQTSSDEFNRWIARSQSDVEMMIVGNPEPNYPYAGVPWFSTVFGRDGIITALECLWLNPAIARGVLEFLASHQATQLDPASEAEPGKDSARNAQEAKCLRWAKSLSAVITEPWTPLRCSSCWRTAYYARTGDRAFIERLWPNVERALAVD